MASQHPELSSHCRAEQQKQSLFLDMIYTYSFFILLWSSYLHFTRYQFIKMKYFFYRWNNFLSIFATRGAWPRPWEGEISQSAGCRRHHHHLTITSHHRLSCQELSFYNSMSILIPTYYHIFVYSPRICICVCFLINVLFSYIFSCLKRRKGRYYYHIMIYKSWV